jgi:beta-galactosidase
VAPPARTDLDDRGVVVGAGPDPRRLPFYAGAMHYSRVEPAAWAAGLRAIRGAGLRIVDTVVPWRAHEARGRFDFTGRLDLGRFLDAAHAAGLAVLVRVGPRVDAELTGFGLPDRILGADAMLARTAAGTPAFVPAPPRAFPIPSYASAAFHAEVRAWYAAVAEVIAPRLAPDGPVVAIGVDTAAAMFYRLGAFDLDYHPDAIAWWHDHAATIGLPADTAPPRDAADPGLAAAWVRFKDVYLARALAQFGAALDDVGLGSVARVHELPPTEPWLYDLPRIAGVAGIAAASARADFPAVRRRALHAAGSATLPIALAAGVGAMPWLPPIDADGDPARARDQVLALLAAGIRGFDLVMAVERDRHYGAAIRRDGTLVPATAKPEPPYDEAAARPSGRTAADWIAPLVAALDSVDWPALRRAAPIALVASRADTRFGRATGVLEPMTPIVLEALGLGPGGAAELGTDPAAIAHRRWFAAIERALAIAAVPYAIVDEGAAPARLAGYRAVVVPTFDRIDRGLLAALRELAIPIVIGPGTPTRDELDRPLGEPLPRRLGRIRPGSLDDLPGLAEDLAGLAGDPPDHYLIERPEEVDADAFVDAAGRTRVVFVSSAADRAVTAVITAEPGRTLRDPFTREAIAVADGRAKIALPRRGVRMLLVE